MSTELKKGDLVMTEHGLAWYQQQWQDNESEPYQVYTIDGKKDNDVQKVTKATRANVESYLKEKGWDWVAKDIIRKYGDIYCSIIEQGGKYFVSSVFGEEQFDTAQEQLAEAILMARLLNAVK